jgi:hypothetical protein
MSQCTKITIFDCKQKPAGLGEKPMTREVMRPAHRSNNCELMTPDVPLGDRINSSPLGEVKVRHAGERRHPGLLVGVICSPPTHSGG